MQRFSWSSHISIKIVKKKNQGNIWQLTRCQIYLHLSFWLQNKVNIVYSKLLQTAFNSPSLAQHAKISPVELPQVYERTATFKFQSITFLINFIGCFRRITFYNCIEVFQSLKLVFPQFFPINPAKVEKLILIQLIKSMCQSITSLTF